VSAVAPKIATIVAQVLSIVLHSASIVLEILFVGLQILCVLLDVRFVTGLLVGLEIGLVVRDIARILIPINAIGSNIAPIVADVAAILPDVVLRHHRSGEHQHGRRGHPHHYRTLHDVTLLLPDLASGSSLGSVSSH
jgi:hypothetical protein